MTSKMPNGNDGGGGSSTQTLDSAASYNGTSNGHGESNGVSNGVLTNGHGGGGGGGFEALVAVPEMCSYCFDVLDGELGGKGVKRQPCFTDVA